MEKKKIKIITCNILHGGELMESLLAFLKQENADILLLQEANHGVNINLPQNQKTMATIQDLMHYRFSHFAPLFKNITPKGDFETGNAIFSRFPIVQDDVTFYNAPYDPSYVDATRKGDYSKDPCNLEHVVLQIDQTDLNVFNTHGIWELSGDDTPERLRMSEIIVENIKKHQNVVLGGDFNVKPNTETIRNIEKHLKNVFRDELKSTFNMKRKKNPGYATAVVDMLFVSPNIQVIEKRCPDVDVSDHLPLVATIEL